MYKYRNPRPKVKPRITPTVNNLPLSLTPTLWLGFKSLHRHSLGLLNFPCKPARLGLRVYDAITPARGATRGGEGQHRSTAAKPEDCAPVRVRTLGARVLPGL